MNVLRTEKRTQVPSALVEVSSINSIVRRTGVAKHTILKLLEDMRCACLAYHHRYVRGVRARRIQCDEIWQFVGAKQKMPRKIRRQPGGAMRKWVALDADTKLCISYLIGGRDNRAGNRFRFRHSRARRRPLCLDHKTLRVIPAMEAGLADHVWTFEVGGSFNQKANIAA